MNLKPSAYLALSIVLSVLFGTSITAEAKDPVNTNFWGVAIKGYDPVAYFTEGKPVKGKSEFEHKWKGAKWRFSSSEHLELFKNMPDKYAPQYGGY